MCLPLRLALCGGDRLPARGKVPAVAESLHPCPLVPRAAAVPRQSEAAAPQAQAGPGEGSRSERLLRRLGKNEAGRRPVLVFTNVVCSVRSEQQG